VATDQLIHLILIMSVRNNGYKHNNNHNSKAASLDTDELDCEDGPGVCSKLLTIFSCFLIVLFLPFSLFFVVKVVQEYERAVIFRLGRLLSGGARGPGVFFVIPCVDIYEKVDLRTNTYEIPPQEILTKNSVTVFVNAIMYYKVANATHAVANVDDYSGSARLLAATTLRNVLGTMNLGNILSERESIAKEMQSTLDVATEPWGVKVERVEVKDVRVPEQLQRAMAAEAEAARNARAKVIAAEGEHKASRSLRQAAEVIMDSPAALQLRYLQTLNGIAAEHNSTIVFPVPIDILSNFMTQGQNGGNNPGGPIGYQQLGQMGTMGTGAGYVQVPMTLPSTAVAAPPGQITPMHQIGEQEESAMKSLVVGPENPITNST